MSTTGTKIARNAGVMMASQLVTWALAFLIAIFQPRYLGATAVGELSIAFSIWMIVSVLLTFGMDTHLIKSIARDPSLATRLLGTSIVIRCALFAVAFVGVQAFLGVMGYATSIVTLSAIVGVAILFALIASAFYAALTGLELMGAVSLANVVNKLVLTVVTLALLFLGFDVYWIAAANIVANIAHIWVLAAQFRRHHPLRLRLDLGGSREMLRVASPYMVTSLTLMVYQQVDKLFIAAMASTEAVGWYSTAMNLFGTLMFIPVALGTVLFPTLSRSYAAGQSELASVARRSFDMMFVLSVPIGLGLSVVARPLVLLLFGAEFAPSGDILAILGFVLIFTYLNTILGNLLISAERTGRWNIVMIAATVLTLPLDLVLIPWAQQTYGNGALGGALSFLLTELLMLSCAILLLPKRTLHEGNVRSVCLTLVAGGAMYAASALVVERNMFLGILAGAAVYPAMILLLRVIPADELLTIRQSLGKALGRLTGRRAASAEAGGD